MRPPYDQWFGAEAFDATYGYDLDALLAVEAPPEPPGFADFWSGLYARAAAVDPAPRLTKIDVGGRAQVFEVAYTSLGGVRLGGWVSLPARGDAEYAVVVGHGYGGRDAPDLDLVPDRTAAIFPVARGLPTAGLVDGIPAAAAEHVLYGIESVESYVHGGCAADLWIAASALLRVVGAAPARLDYVGASFGGGIGALALPWDPRFTAAVLRVPSFGHYDLRLTMPCTGSGEAVRGYVADHPEARDVLRHFDAATAAGRLRIPTMVAPATWDAAVPPPGQFAVYNALAGPKALFVFSAGHADYPGEPDEYARFVSAAKAFLRP